MNTQENRIVEPSGLLEDTELGGALLLEDTPDVSELAAGDTPVDVADASEMVSEEPAEESSVVEEVASSEEPYVGLLEDSLSDPILEELPAAPGDISGDLQEAIEVGAMGMIDKEQIIAELRGLVSSVDRAGARRVSELRKLYARIREAETSELRRVYMEQGGLEVDFVPPKDETYAVFSGLIAEYTRNRNRLSEEDRARRRENYRLKNEILSKMEELLTATTDFDVRRNAFRELQQEWKRIGSVTADQGRELQRAYMIQNDRFFDLVTINNELRDYDFRKNLEMKTALCESAEKLLDEPDVVLAYNQVHQLFNRWKEIGSVSKKWRDKTWDRFHRAFETINERHRVHYEEKRADEAVRIKEKEDIRAYVESIDYTVLKTMKDWDRQSQEVINRQKRWRELGLTRGRNAKMNQQFRRICDTYFAHRDDFFRERKGEFEKNASLKLELVLSAESLRDSTDWSETSAALSELQRRWRRIGSSYHGKDDQLWKRFRAACDAFFDRKTAHRNSLQEEETANLALKESLITRIETLDPSLPAGEALDLLRTCATEWNDIGHVPIKTKTDLYKRFRAALDKQYDRLEVAQSERRLEQYKVSLEVSNDKGRLQSEREKLSRQLERMRSEMQTYENNIGFLKPSREGEGENFFRREIERKIDHLRKEIQLTEKKIMAIDESNS
jgi:hypothetical protein